MLVLKRKQEESVCVGDDVQIKILGVRGGDVLVGITAPDNVQIDRLEVREKSLVKLYRRLIALFNEL